MNPQIVIIGPDGELTREGELLIGARIGCDPRTVRDAYRGVQLRRTSNVRNRVLQELRALGIAPRISGVPHPMALTSLQGPTA